MKKAELTTRERIKRALEHKDGDRVAICDRPWDGTIRRWIEQGMPAGMDWRDYFGVDKTEDILADVSPRYESKLIEETDTYTIRLTEWGTTIKYLKGEDTTPEFLDFKVKDSEVWKDAKKRMRFDESRTNLKYYLEHVPQWINEGRWVRAAFWFGFDVTHSWFIGTETLLMAMIEEPSWVTDVFNTYLDLNIKMFDYLWKSGVRFDSINWPDDMGYKNNQFFSVSTYNEMLKPFHKRASDWAKAKGLKVEFHSCGNIMPFIPHLIEIGVDSLNPIEVKAGMDPLVIKKLYGDKLALHGGLNALLWPEHDKVIAEIERLVPVLKQGGGYIFSSDHSIPNNVTLKNFKDIVAKVKQCGKY